MFTGFKRTGDPTNKGRDLNIWPDAGESGKGAYFYTSSHGAWVSDASYRYDDPTIYMPATGQYQVGIYGDDTPMSAIFSGSIETPIKEGIYWTSTSGEALWFIPDWYYPTNAIQLPSTVNPSSALPVRPVKTPKEQ